MRSTRFLYLSVALAAILALGACGSDDAAQEDPVDPTPAGADDDAGAEGEGGADGDAPGDRAQQGSGAWAATATSLRGEDGSTEAFECTPDGTPGSVWGTNIYTDDSSVCTAAVQAGLITTDDGGEVTIQVTAGRDEYFGSTHNGVTSSSYGQWPGSFVFPEAEPLEVATEIAWDRAANFYDPGDAPVTVTCMANGSHGSVWGTGPFTADSSICTAALFAGEISEEEGGEVTFEFSEGLDSYEGGEANGATTSEYGSYSSSFDFVG